MEKDGASYTSPGLKMVHQVREVWSHGLAQHGNWVSAAFGNGGAEESENFGPIQAGSFPWPVFVWPVS